MTTSATQTEVVDALPVAEAFKNKTGKRQALNSINKWLALNIPGGAQFEYFFLANQTTAKFPRVEVSETQVSDLGASAMGQVVFNAGPNLAIPSSDLGTLRPLLLQFDIYAKDGENDNPEELVYFIRDRLIYGLTQAGVTSDLTDAVLVEPIKLLDYEQNPAEDTGIPIWVPTEEDNHIFEQYFPPSGETPDVHQVRLNVKFYWWELIPN